MPKSSSAAAVQMAVAKLKANVKKHSAPDIDLTPRPAPPPKKAKEVIPELREAITNPAERLKAQQIIKQYIILGIQESEAKKAKKPLNRQLKSILGKNQVSKMMYDGNTVNYFNAPRTTLSEGLLIEAGVSPLIIAKCKVTKDAYTLKITVPGEEEEGDD